MYLAKLTLNAARLASRSFLSSPEAVHAAVMKSFSNHMLEESATLGRPLWRLENGRDPLLYISAPSKPSCEHIIEQAGRVEDEQGCIIKNYEPFMNDLAEGDRLLFRLKANPVVSIRSNRVPHRTVEFKKDWLNVRAGQNGFELTADTFDATKSMDLDFYKRGNRVQIATTTFQGMLTVSDPDLLRGALRFGIGPQKAYGLGLLSLGKLRS